MPEGGGDETLRQWELMRRWKITAWGWESRMSVAGTGHGGGGSSSSDGDEGYGWQLRTLLSRLTLFSYSAGSSFFAFRVLKST